MKKLFFLCILFLAACSTSDNEPQPADGVKYVRIQAEYADGTTEHSSIIVIK